MKRVNSSGSRSRVQLSPDVDFDDLFNGDTWELNKGEDFDCSTSSAANLVRSAFRERYGVIVIRENKDNNTIQVMATQGSRWRK